MRRIKIAKILRNESDFLAKYFLSNLSEIPNFNRLDLNFIFTLVEKLSYGEEDDNDEGVEHHAKQPQVNHLDVGC